MSQKTKDNLQAILFFAGIIAFFVLCMHAYTSRTSNEINTPTISVFEQGEKITGTSVYYRQTSKNSRVSIIELEDGRYYVNRRRVPKGRTVDLTADDVVTVVSTFKDNGSNSKWFVLRTDSKYAKELKEAVSDRGNTPDDFIGTSVFEYTHSEF